MEPSRDADPPTLRELFAGFFTLGAMGFGGLLPITWRVIVEQRRWLSPAEFNDLLALCQFLPGPNICNMSIALGARFRGVPGSLACISGLMAVPLAAGLGLGGVYARYGQEPVVVHGFMGLAAVASGLVLATAFKIVRPIRGSPLAMAMAAAMLVATLVLHWPLLPTMLVLAPVSVVLHMLFA